MARNILLVGVPALSQTSTDDDIPKNEQGAKAMGEKEKGKKEQKKQPKLSPKEKRKLKREKKK